jgi:hypothetical protein
MPAGTMPDVNNWIQGLTKQIDTFSEKSIQQFIGTGATIYFLRSRATILITQKIRPDRCQ